MVPSSGEWFKPYDERAAPEGTAARSSGSHLPAYGRPVSGPGLHMSPTDPRRHTGSTKPLQQILRRWSGAGLAPARYTAGLFVVLPVGMAAGRGADWPRTSRITATAKKARPSGPKGGGCTAINADRATRIATDKGAPALRSATAAATTAVTQARPPM
jgi:hypothetical protein